MRIVSLLPGATEIVCALGLADDLVAISHECDYPKSVTHLPRITDSTLPAVSSTGQIDQEVAKAVQQGEALYRVDGDLLKELKPDLIITQGVCDVCAVNTGTVEETLVFLPKVLAGNVQTITLKGGTFAGILNDIRRVGQATCVADKAHRLTGRLNVRWGKLQKSRPSSKPNVLMLEWPQPFFYGGHWVPEMVEAAGGIDVMGKIGEPSGRCTTEHIYSANPDIICSIACGYDLEKNLEFARQIIDNEELSGVKAVQQNQVWALHSDHYFNRPGPRVVIGAEQLQAVFKGRDKLYNEIIRASC